MKNELRRETWRALAVRASSLGSLSVLLVGCGGGSGPNSTSAPSPPSPAGSPLAMIAAPAAVRSYATVTLDGTGSRDSTATLTGYTWKQTSGPSVTLTGANTSTASFVAPNVSAQTALAFSVTLTDSSGATNTTNVSVNVNPVSSSRTTTKFVALRFLQASNTNFHTDAIVVDGPPLSGASTTVQATLAGFVQTPTFSLVDGSGNTLGSATLTLSGNSSAQPLDFAGSITVPSVPFYVLAAGTTSDGQSFSLKSPLLITPMNMTVHFTPGRAKLKAGASTTAQLSIYNGGPTATFTTHFTDPYGLLTQPADSSTQIAQGQTVSVPVPITFPTSSPTFIPKVLASTSVSGDPNRAGTSTLAVWLDGTP
jgi:hypothetical protein